MSRALADLEVSQAALRTNEVQREVFECERRLRVLALSEESADVFVWTVSLICEVRLLLSSFDDYFETVSDTETSTVSKIRALLGRDADKVNLCDIIWRKYGVGGKLGCPICQQRPCGCYVEDQRQCF